jgi:OmpA-OmpF porin, OOP family
MVVLLAAPAYPDEESAKAMSAALERSGHVDIYGLVFDTGKATLKDEAERTLGTIYLLLTENPSLQLEIRGHSDAQGSDEWNLKMSAARAEGVRARLIHAGIAESRLTSKGMGESMPLDTNATAAGRARNRRIELVKR